VPAAPTPKKVADSATVQGFTAFCSSIAFGIRNDLSTALRGYLAGAVFSATDFFLAVVPRVIFLVAMIVFFLMSGTYKTPLLMRNMASDNILTNAS